MKQLTFALLPALTLAASCFAQTETWQIDPAHSSAQFAVRHMGISTVRGAFAKLSGTAQVDAADVTKSRLTVSIDTASVDTRVEMRDNDLKSDHFFDVQKYPTMTFASGAIERVGDGKLKVAGELTLHGVTKPVVLNVDGLTEPVKDMRGNWHRGASATATIDRTNFGMTTYPQMIGNNVEITIDVDLVKQAAPGAK